MPSFVFMLWYGGYRGSLYFLISVCVCIYAKVEVSLCMGARRTAGLDYAKSTRVLWCKPIQYSFDLEKLPFSSSIFAEIYFLVFAETDP